MGATVTALRPPTVEEVRAAIQARYDEEAGLDRLDTIEAGLRGLVTAAAEAFINAAANTLERGHAGVWEDLPAPKVPTLWHDLRPSEASRLMELLGEAQDRAADRCWQVIVDELLGVAAAFSAEFPDAQGDRIR